MKTEITTALASLNQSSMLCDLPDSEFVTGGAINDACRAAGYEDSGWLVVGQLHAWTKTVSEFAEIISPSIHPITNAP